ncbi:MAG TPA: hypothetical protein VES88_12500 [Gemmatimonadaceae bacterium]|nr:hypothetical protein [Gemmatimonadaceae bacterium]
MERDPTKKESECPTPPTRVPDVHDLVGLALSGGGIRSASFNLGVLQGLADRKVLWIFDYLSTVSGGGFVGAWWSAWLSRAQREPGSIFPEAEELEPDRREATAQLLEGVDRETGLSRTDTTRREAGRPEASVIAKRGDPIHFLRIFSNYLTPRTGAASPDTWRLISWYTRSLLFTWAALLPLFCAAVLVAQAFYLSNPQAARAFVCPLSPAAAEAAPKPTASSVGPTSAEPPHAFCPSDEAYMPHSVSRTARLDYLAKPFVLFLAVWLTLAMLWLAHSSARPRLAVGSMVLVLLLGSFVLRLFRTSSSKEFSWSVALVVGATIAFHLVQSWLAYHKAHKAEGAEARAPATAGDHRAWLTRQQARLLKAGTFVFLFLLFAGFAHDILWFLFSGSESVLMTAVRRAAGWGGLLLTVGSAAYAVIKASPTSMPGSAREPGRIGQILVSIAPPLAVIALTLGFGIVSHELIVKTMRLPKNVLVLANVVAWLALLEVVFALFESWDDPDLAPDESKVSRWWRLVPEHIKGVILRKRTKDTGDKTPWYYWFSPRGWARVAAAAAVATVFGLATNRSWSDVLAAMRASLVTLGSIVISIAILVAVVGISLARRKSRIALRSARPVVLLGIASAGAVLSLLSNGGIANRAQDNAMLAAFLWIAVLIGAVVGIGWLADPNLLSMHGFYKGRLTRAYLGASNSARDNEKITEAAPGDDVKLSDLWNHAQGGPYHLINTTLSLVGGSDLATSQRSAENFIMSKYHCGSARVGYRCTSKYMSGHLTLGAAAAVSGAAVSPTMGSKSPSAALSLLLSLMSVRLGYWAPTPSGRRWNEPHARLWPFYLLRETLANTGQIGTYCYLTDGGHFDNTGVYALVERGCRYIVCCDCGADPALGFDDIGAAIRRCRIDFGTEIMLDIDNYAKRKSQDRSRLHFVNGTIVFQDAHLKLLGIEPTAESKRGVILWIKPVVRPGDSADVRQYKLECPEFPQQSTADQWYDESQFESYRRLGYDSAREAFSPPRTGEVIRPGDFEHIGDLFKPPVNVQGKTPT